MSGNSIRKMAKYCFDQAVLQLYENGLSEEADTLIEATVHWLRHTGISDGEKFKIRVMQKSICLNASSCIKIAKVFIRRLNF